MSPRGDLAAVSDNLNGTYAAEYTVRRSGVYLVQVQLGGVHVMGSPFQVSVLAGATNARASVASGPGLHTCVAGTPASFSIVARDEFGNQRSVCGDDFQVTLAGPEKPKGSGKGELLNLLAAKKKKKKKAPLPTGPSASGP